MKAEKGNKVYTIDEGQKKYYLALGYDIIGDDGEILERAPGKTVPYEKYAALEKENAELKAKANPKGKEETESKE